MLSDIDNEHNLVLVQYSTITKLPLLAPRHRDHRSPLITPSMSGIIPTRIIDDQLSRDGVGLNHSVFERHARKKQNGKSPFVYERPNARFIYETQ